jgi:hypothetical protein
MNMATTIDSIGIRGLRLIHFRQLYQVLLDSEDEGCYYGDKAQFFKRHLELKDWLASVIHRLDDPSVKIPKRK